MFPSGGVAALAINAPTPEVQVRVPKQNVACAAIKHRTNSIAVAKAVAFSALISVNMQKHVKYWFAILGDGQSAAAR
jgi:hypothetical protein